MNIAYPQLQVRSDSLISYIHTERDYCFAEKNRMRDAMQRVRDKSTTYSGVLCPGGKKRLTKTIEMLVQMSPWKKVYNPVRKKQQWFKLSFITLTFETGQHLTAKDGHDKCLESFLQWLRRVHGCKLYVWKAELQSKQRDQLHYHITCDAFIDKDALREKWIELQINAGLLNMDAYFKKHGHSIVPCTEIKSVRNFSGMAGYFNKKVATEIVNNQKIIGEMSKGRQNINTVGGKVWDACNVVKAAKYYTIIPDYATERRLAEMEMNKECEVIVTDQCRIYKLKTPGFSVLSAAFQKEYKQQMTKLRNAVIERKKAEKELIEVLQPPKVVNFNIRYDLFSTS